MHQVNSEIPELEKEPRPLPETESRPPKMEAKKESNKNKSGSGLAFLALLISLLALAGAGWIAWQDHIDRSDTEQRAISEVARLESADSELSLKIRQLRDEIEAARAADDGSELDALHQRMTQDRQKLSAFERDLQEQLALSRSLQSAAEAMQSRLVAAEAALSGMSSRELDAGGELDLAEVDYLLRLANERLKLFADPVSADQALEVADMHLAAIDNPIYLGVRRDIAQARQELAQLDMPDSLAIANELDALQQTVSELDFPSDEPPGQQAASVDGESWWDKVKNAFSGLVTVRRSTEQEMDRISIEDMDYVRQRVWLQLEIAHLALMRHDQAAFRHSLERVEESVTSWFDSSDETTTDFLASLGALQVTVIELDVPDITAPWTTLRAVRAGQPRPAPPISAETPEEDQG